MLKLLIIGLLLGCFLLSCDQSFSPTPQAKIPVSQPFLSQNEEVVDIKMRKYATQLVFQHADFQQKNLSENQKKELKTWWDSLPQPLQSEIKAKQLDIQVISHLHEGHDQPISSNLADAKIEQTGAALERVIGAPTEMTYTVNTTTTNGGKKSEMATTDILIMETVTVKLSEFALQMPSHSQAGISTETTQMLQNWWINLPEELQEKVKNQSLWIDLQLVEYQPNPQLQAQQEQKLFALEDILHRLIGFYQIGRRSQPLAKIQAQLVQAKPQPLNPNLANQQIILQIRLGKSPEPAPSAS